MACKCDRSLADLDSALFCSVVVCGMYSDRSLFWLVPGKKSCRIGSDRGYTIRIDKSRIIHIFFIWIFIMWRETVPEIRHGLFLFEEAC